MCCATLTLGFAVAALSLPTMALAQSATSKADLEAGAGLAIGGGVENSAPSLPTVSFGAAVWLGRQWGIAVNHVTSYGEDRWEPPIETTTRIFAGQEHLRYTRITGRYRRQVGGGDIVLGFGVIVGGSYANIVFLKSSDRSQRQSVKTTWQGVTVEVSFFQAFSESLGARVGIALDTGTETTVLRPFALAVYSF
jgi:hypothetical protein